MSPLLAPRMTLGERLRSLMTRPKTAVLGAATRVSGSVRALFAPYLPVPKAAVSPVPKAAVSPRNPPSRPPDASPVQGLDLAQWASLNSTARAALSPAMSPAPTVAPRSAPRASVAPGAVPQASVVPLPVARASVAPVPPPAPGPDLLSQWGALSGAAKTEFFRRHKQELVAIAGAQTPVPPAVAVIQAGSQFADRRAELAAEWGSLKGAAQAAFFRQHSADLAQFARTAGDADTPQVAAGSASVTKRRAELAAEWCALQGAAKTEFFRQHERDLIAYAAAV